MAKETYLDLQTLSEEEAYKVVERLRGFPRPQYPFPDITPPYFQKLREESFKWIDEDFAFHSEAAREKHKTHYFTDINARAMPFLTFEEQIPIGRFTGTFAMLDDYLGRATVDEIDVMRERIRNILFDKEGAAPQDHGVYHQAYLIRKECLQLGMPIRQFHKFVIEIDSLVCGYQNEKQYVLANTPPPFAAYSIIRDLTAGGIPYAKYACLQKNYRTLPDKVLDHPHILAIHAIISRLIGYHNDIVSLPKELCKRGDVVNIVPVLMHEHNLDLEDAYMMAMQIHDSTLDDFMTLLENLPDFGPWQELAYEYVKDFGTMLQGVWSWHTRGDNNRYTLGWIVDSEFDSKKWEWKDKGKGVWNEQA
ncbi:terpene synthase family protein [Sinomicrobium sp. M5D2P17]